MSTKRTKTMTVKQAIALAEVRELVASGEAAFRRRRSRLSEADVANAVGVTAAAVSRWENGQRFPTGAPALVYGRLLKELGDVDHDVST
jgi:DNA-binding transcriptional regulator YiaG